MGPTHGASASRARGVTIVEKRDEPGLCPLSGWPARQAEVAPCLGLWDT